MEDDEIHAFQQQQILGGPVQVSDAEQPVQPAQPVESQCDGHVVVWTDGACRNNQDSRLRRAGAGIYYGPQHHRNVAYAVPGVSQTNQRAELLAVVLLLETEHRALEVRTDSQWVYDGAVAWAGWQSAGWMGDHPDLWQRLSGCLADGAETVRFTKVLGRAEKIDVQGGRVTQLDKDGNDGADAMAVLGAKNHCAPDELRATARQRRVTAKAVHRMMLRITQARQAKLEQLGLGVDGPEADAGDRGSEADADDLLGLLPGADEEYDEEAAADAGAAAADDAGAAAADARAAVEVSAAVSFLGAAAAAGVGAAADVGATADAGDLLSGSHCLPREADPG